MLDGALSCAIVGNVIGEGDGVGELVGLGVGLGVGDAVGEGVGDPTVFGWDVHAVRTRTRRSAARTDTASHDLGHEASELGRRNS